MGSDIPQPDDGPLTEITMNSPQAEKLSAGGTLAAIDPSVRCDTGDFSGQNFRRLDDSVRELHPEEGEKAAANSDIVHDRRRRIRQRAINCVPSVASRGSGAKHLTPNATPPGRRTGLATPFPPAPNDESALGEGGTNGNGNGNGNGDGGNGRRKKPGKIDPGEQDETTEEMEDMLPPSPDVLEAVREIDKVLGSKVEAVSLYPTSQNQREYRERLFGPPMWTTIHDLQKNPALKAIENENDPTKRIERYYALQAAADAYKSGDVPEENIALMLGLKNDDDLMKLVCSIEGNQVARKKSVELAPGNGEISRTLCDVRDRFLPLAHLLHVMPHKGQVRREVFTTAYNNALGIAASARKTVDPFIQAVDFVQKFVDKGRKKLIDARKGDICAPLDEIYETTGLTANDADIVVGNLFFDRVNNLNAALKFAKTLAKLDGSTQFLFGFYAPFSPKTDSFSKNENIPVFDCFDPFAENKGDIRKSWVSDDPEKPLSRSETIYRIMYSLITNGFKITRAAEHEYEVYSAHCIAETAGVLRTDPRYAFLEDKDFGDEELNERRDAVFNGTLHDDELVGFPERENIILVSGNITRPEDGRVYEKVDFASAVKYKRLEVNAAHPKFGFLRNYSFPKTRMNRLKDRLFASGGKGFLPFREHMRVPMMEARKEYLRKLKDKDREPSSNR